MGIPDIRVRSWVRASAADAHTGLLGYISVFVGDLVLDGITLRRTTTGRLALSFPARTDRAGKRHPYIRPVDAHAGQRLEREVVKAILGQDAEASS